MAPSEFAHDLASRIFNDRDIKPSLNVQAYFDTEDERAYMRHVLNGPVSSYVTKKGWRWVSAADVDLVGITTVAGFEAIIAAHLVSPGTLGGDQ